MIKIKTREEIELMRESALIVSKTLGLIAKEVKPGITTLYLDKLAEEFIRDNDAIPGFLGLYDFPNTLCMSPNAQVVHGIPNNKPLEDCCWDLGNAVILLSWHVNIPFELDNLFCSN